MKDPDDIEDDEDNEDLEDDEQKAEEAEKVQAMTATQRAAYEKKKAKEALAPRRVPVRIEQLATQVILPVLRMFARFSTSQVPLPSQCCILSN